MFKILHVHFDEFRDAQGFHIIAPDDSHEDVQRAVSHASSKGFDTLWVHHGYWPKGEVVEYTVNITIEEE